MTIGQRLEADELSDVSAYELYSVLGDHDTPKLYEQRFTVDHDHDCPTGGGNTIDRKSVLIDRLLYQEIMDGAFKKTGLTPEQIVGRITDHEHVEIAINHGDNPCDTYYPCHKRALKMEHLGVLKILCPSSPAEAREILERYEATIWPALVRCYHRPIAKPHKLYWCSPLLDEPSERDEEILEQLRKLGVLDATKHSKYDVRYGMAHHSCITCSGWYPELVSQERGQLAACHRVSGLVRDDRGCSMWAPQTEKSSGA